MTGMRNALKRRENSLDIPCLQRLTHAFVGAGLLAIASGQSTYFRLAGRYRQQAGSYEIGVSGPFLSGSDRR
ncbi:hypothetical protein FBY04_14218 [Pseudomonas sp. SJZ080]|nr:hypothetical protein FBY04_14218 [Pseudomonas sp. SJZ080]